MKNFKISLLLISITLSVNNFAATSFTPAAQPTGWLARPSLTNINLTSNSETLYQLNYNKDTWSGDILAKNISDNAVVNSTGPWVPETAATLLDGLNYDTGRKIVTRNGSTNIPFRWSSLSTTQQTAIGDATAGPKIVNFVRGDRSNEEPAGASYRARQHVLGDILHSTLSYWKHDASTRRLYVGANDGMLHVFNATNGSEVFAYVPSMLIPNLKTLTSKPYVHTFFVDGGITIANVDFSGTLKTILVGGLGAGGKGLYALDISSPSPADETAAAGKILWEIPATGDFANLGYTYGTPRISRLNDGTAVAIAGNGYMNSGNGHAILYVINLNTGALVKAIDTGSGSSASPNGLSTPTLFDTNGDGKVDYAYAGDLDGHMWKFNLSGNAPSNYAVLDNAGGTGALFTTSPAQAITTAPVVTSHPYGGRMVAFATGRLLTDGDSTDTSVNYAYGIWDGAPAANNVLLTQTLSAATFGTGNVRTITANTPDWSTGSAHHYGWKVALPAGERVTGELPFEKNGRFYFLSTNPTITNNPPPNGDNWLYELVLTTGGSPGIPIFDLNNDESFSSSDLADGCTPSGVITCIPTAKPLGAGVFSQPTYVEGAGLDTTLYNYHPDTVTSTGSVSEPTDPGVSGGHFDFDIYYYGSSVVTTKYTPTDISQTKTVCAKSSDVASEFNNIQNNIILPTNTTFCKTPTFSSGYNYMTKYTTGSSGKNCRNNNNKYQTITCNTYNAVTSSTVGQYSRYKHVHEYDDIYDVTGVNMLNASDTAFNLSNAITNTSTSFKVLVMNQYLNPAAKLSVGGANYESVKTYKNLASQTNATTLLSGLPTYTRANAGTLIYNLPLDAFKSKDWWGDGAGTRAGLIPTVYSCVYNVNTDGSMVNTNGRGLIGPNGERFDGALTIQLIKDTTPASALELNHNGNGGLSDSERAKYGWRVKQSLFKDYVLAEYTTYWHHPNNLCYGQTGWIASAPEDPISDATAKTPATGSADPKDGIFSAGLAVKSVTSTVNGGTTTTVTTYSDNSTYTKVAVTNSDGSITVTQTFRDGTTAVTRLGTTSVANSNITTSPYEEIATGATGRQSWWEILQ